MSLYPSLEDMHVDKILQSQSDLIAQHQNQDPHHVEPPSYASLLAGPTGSAPKQHNPTVYPGLAEFMGLELSQQMIAANMPEYLTPSATNQMAVRSDTTVAPASTFGMVAPLSSNSVGLQRAQVTHGIRELILCKGADKKVGLRVQSINKGVFVCMVIKGSPAAMGGLRFGDQLLQVNGQLVAGYSVDDVHKLLKKSPKNDISVVVRDRPFERTITMHKSSAGNVGFQFSDGKIYSIVKDSSAARNGLLTEHHLLEVDGQNVVGMKDKEITAIIQAADKIVTVTIIPSFIYEHMMKKISSSFIRGKMDHSIPDF